MNVRVAVFCCAKVFLYQSFYLVFIKVANCYKAHKSWLIKPLVKLLHVLSIHAFYHVHVAYRHSFLIDAACKDVLTLGKIEPISWRVSLALLFHYNATLLIKLACIDLHAIDPVRKNLENVL